MWKILDSAQHFAFSVRKTENSVRHLAFSTQKIAKSVQFSVFRAENAEFRAAFRFSTRKPQNPRGISRFPRRKCQVSRSIHFFCAAFQIFRAENTKCRVAETEFVPSAGRGEMTTARTWTKYTNSPRNCDLRSHSSESSLRKFLASAAMNANCLWRVTENSRLSFRANCSTFDTYLPAICESEHRRACSPTREK